MSGVVGWWYEGDACQPDFRRRLANHGDEVADLVRNLRTAILTVRPELTERIYPRLARLGLPPPASDPEGYSMLVVGCTWRATSTCKGDLFPELPAELRDRQRAPPP